MKTRKEALENVLNKRNTVVEVVAVNKEAEERKQLVINFLVGVIITSALCYLEYLYR